MIEDSFYFGVEEEEEADDAQQFPAMYPFSATVPEIGLALLKVRRPPPTGSAVFVFPSSPRRLSVGALSFASALLLSFPRYVHAVVDPRR